MGLMILIYGGGEAICWKMISRTAALGPVDLLSERENCGVDRLEAVEDDLDP